MEPTEIPNILAGLIQQLHDQHCSCVILQSNQMRSFHNRGIADLYQLYKHERNFMSGAAIADKVIGKGAAALLVLGGFKLVYADVISQSAYSLLQDANIETHYGKIVDHIENRSKTGWCPVESRCLNETTPEGCLKQIELFINQTNNEKIHTV